MKFEGKYIELEKKFIPSKVTQTRKTKVVCKIKYNHA